jgi:hypothetical protein
MIRLFMAYAKRDGIGWLGFRIEGRSIVGQFRGLNDGRLFDFSWGDSTLSYRPARATQNLPIVLDLPQAIKTRLRGSRRPLDRYLSGDTYLCGDRQIPASQVCKIRHAKLRQAQPQIRRQCRG